MPKPQPPTPATPAAPAPSGGTAHKPQTFKDVAGPRGAPRNYDLRTDSDEIQPPPSGWPGARDPITDDMVRSCLLVTGEPHVWARYGQDGKTAEYQTPVIGWNECITPEGIWNGLHPVVLNVDHASADCAVDAYTVDDFLGLFPFKPGLPVVPRG